MIDQLAQRTREFLEALHKENSKIFFQRAHDMYDSMNMDDMSVFLFSMLGVKIRAMFDPTMLGRDKLVASIADMDRIRCVERAYGDASQFDMVELLRWAFRGGVVVVKKKILYEI